MAFSSPIKSTMPDSHPLSVLVEDYAKTSLLAQPGTQYLYSNTDMNTIGRIIEIASGMSYEQFMQKRIFDPLGMTHTAFFPGPQAVVCLLSGYRANHAKDALQIMPVTRFAMAFDDRSKRFPISAGGLFSTAADVTAFLPMIANNGVYKGRRLIAKASIWQMTAKETRGVYGFGWMLGGDAISHDGAYGTKMYIHPKSGLLTVFLVQQYGAWPRDGNRRVGQAFAKSVETFPKDAPP
jgi:CubicO group peptidase (beta-lactamase class C family)